MNDYILDELHEAVRERERTEKAIREIVVAARREGHSWEVIARMIGVTRQAAQQRYGKGTGE